MKQLTLVKWAAALVVSMVIFPPAATCATEDKAGGAAHAPAKAHVRDASSSSLVVFGMRPEGGEDAKYYAVAFAQALADRLYCAPDCITQQYARPEVNRHLDYNGCKPGEPVSDEAASGVAKLLGAAYAVTGEFHLAEDQVSIICSVTKLDPDECEWSTRVEGPLSQLPSMQAKLAEFVAKGMCLELTPEQSETIKKPTFTNPKAIEFCGRAMLCEGKEKAKTYTWDMVKTDPDSLFAAIRLLGFYGGGSTSYRQVVEDTQFSEMLKRIDELHKGNPYIELYKAMLLVKKSECQAAQDALTALVKAHPEMGNARLALAYVARQRQDGGLAVSEGKALTALWPANPVYHTALAYGHNTAAHAVRQGRYFMGMSDDAEKKWAENTKAAFSEASTALELAPNYPDAWSALRWAALGLSKQKKVDKAYRELIRLEPKNLNHYEDYATGLLPQWGGTEEERREFVEQVEKEFGKDSYEATMIRARFEVRKAFDTKDWDEAIRLMNEGIEKAKTDQQRGHAMYYKCQNLYWSDKRKQLTPQALGLAKEGFAQWHTPEWEYQLAFWYMGYYSLTRDLGAVDESLLAKATDHFGAYAADITGDPNGHLQFGNCLLNQGKKLEARKEFEKAIELDPQYETARAMLKRTE